jgi:hypothetical protein
MSDVHKTTTEYFSFSRSRITGVDNDDEAGQDEDIVRPAMEEQTSEALTIRQQEYHATNIEATAQNGSYGPFQLYRRVKQSIVFSTTVFSKQYQLGTETTLKSTGYTSSLRCWFKTQRVVDFRASREYMTAWKGGMDGIVRLLRTGQIHLNDVSPEGETLLHASQYRAYVRQLINICIVCMPIRQSSVRKTSPRCKSGCECCR